ncbi:MULTISPECIES: pilin [unclassified Neisseria]|uniref:pilin n=1 Tax=unclassified Neisseria TaxID=2623750 RepID=UPI00266652FC|nr:MULTISPECIES: pilin [unclassified Neisseria]MDO1510747.1 pilin [Neisseria sp. MVDL19-042950]MDO1517037.1 pilin [Neisseria sp. MVDL18-041461]MDO1564399.1 pilin [Neisseria sp. MVDL20-010259]
MNKLDTRKGFTLIELMIVIAIVGILAVIAYPQYNNYKARAQITEALVFASSIKMDVSTSYFGQGWVPIASYNGTNSQYGRYIKSAQVNSSGTITITMNDEANITIRNKTLTLIPTVNPSGVAENIIQWECDSSSKNSIPKNYLPSPCR